MHELSIAMSIVGMAEEEQSAAETRKSRRCICDWVAWPES